MIEFGVAFTDVIFTVASSDFLLNSLIISETLVIYFFDPSIIILNFWLPAS